VVIPKDLVSSFLNVRNAGDTLATSVLHQMAMADFIREGHFSRHIRRMRAAYLQAREGLAAALLAQTDGLLEIVGDPAGMQLLVLLPPGADAVAIAARLPQTGITIYAMSQCYLRPPPRGGLIIGYANLRLEDIPATVAALRAALLANLPKQREYLRRTISSCDSAVPA